jgi:3',5'-nucleoside bisphosphate phosphatase
MSAGLSRPFGKLRVAPSNVEGRAPSRDVIDLHLHTTASDGLCEPSVLVDLAWRAGIRTMSVTDHDTVAALPDVEAAAAASGISFVPGIEITAVHDGRDIHVLGYFIDRADAALEAFLEKQRADRVRRVTVMADKLATIGKPIDRQALLASRPRGRSLGRPMLAKALVKAGHVVDAREAFDQLIGEGRPAFVPRIGPGPADVIAVIRRAGGVASLAHPGLLRRDDLIPPMIDAGLTAVEAFHSDHDAATTEHYLVLAERHGILVSGGSDYHGERERRRAAFGTVGLPRDRFERLAAQGKKQN